MSRELSYLREQLQSLGKNVPHVKYEVTTSEECSTATTASTAVTSERVVEKEGDLSKIVDNEETVCRIKKEPNDEGELADSRSSPQPGDIIAPT